MRYETIATLVDETYLITPLEEGQALHFNGNRLTASAGEPIRVYGTGPVEISQGKWGNRLRAPGIYTGGYFDGDTASENGFIYEWTGTPNASTSNKRADINSPRYTEYLQPLPITLTGAGSRSVYVPVPPNHRLWLSYVATESLLQANGVTIAQTPPEAPAPVWARYSNGVELKWSGTGTVWGAWGLILKDGETPTPDARWVPGKGASGLKFKGEPQISGISAVYGDDGGLLNASATLIETEMWDQS